MRIGQQFLLLRYSNNIVSDTIEKHQAVINRLGYCWFGKISTVPSVKIQKAVLDEEEPKIILYTKGVAHECSLLAITDKKPTEGCPDYYEKEGIYPSVYFKLSSIEPVESKELEQYRIISTGRLLPDAIWHSMTSYFFAEWPDTNASKDIKEIDFKMKTSSKEEKRPLLDKNDCIYRKNGKCTCRNCISYQYECERPSMCLKQKR